VKPLDFVKTPKGNIAIITEVSGGEASIEFIGEPPIGKREHNAWWDFDELKLIDSLPNLMARTMSHPFGTGRSAGETHFPLTK
jgi:hypothetical protein